MVWVPLALALNRGTAGRSGMSRLRRRDAKGKCFRSYYRHGKILRKAQTLSATKIKHSYWSTGHSTYNDDANGWYLLTWLLPSSNISTFCVVIVFFSLCSLLYYFTIFSLFHYFWCSPCLPSAFVCLFQTQLQIQIPWQEQWWKLDFMNKIKAEMKTYSLCLKHKMPSAIHFLWIMLLVKCLLLKIQTLWN